MAIVAIFVATLTGLGFSWTGVWVLPKCRYGDPECYFKVNLCAPDSSSLDQTDKSETVPVELCRLELRQRAIEGSSNDPVLPEQLSIPLMAVVVSCVPAALASATFFVQRTVLLVAAGKMVLAVTLSMLCIGIDVLQTKTFDCRWWHDSHHGNADQCKQGLVLYVIGALLIIVSEIVLLVLLVRMYEWEMRELIQMRISCLTNTAMSSIQQGRFREAVSFCSKAISMDRTCVNAHFRRAIALSRLREWDEAILDLQAALALQPGNSAVQWELEQCKTQLGQQGVRGENDCGDHASEDDIEEEDYENEEESLLPVKKVRFAIPMQPSLLE